MSDRSNHAWSFFHSYLLQASTVFRTGHRDWRCWLHFATDLRLLLRKCHVLGIRCNFGQCKLKTFLNYQYQGGELRNCVLMLFACQGWAAWCSCQSGWTVSIRWLSSVHSYPLQTTFCSLLLPHTHHSNKVLANLGFVSKSLNRWTSGGKSL